MIEETAKRTLAEMRAMVGALRGSDDASRTPQGGVGDLHRLADRASGTLQIDVELSGDLDDLGPLVDAAVYRIAQESITNALRHARHASRVSVTVVGYLLAWTSGNWTMTFYISSAIYFLGAICWLFLDSHTPVERNIDSIRQAA